MGVTVDCEGKVGKDGSTCEREIEKGGGTEVFSGVDISADSPIRRLLVSVCGVFAGVILMIGGDRSEPLPGD